jgi:hypothetical protein
MSPFCAALSTVFLAYFAVLYDLLYFLNLSRKRRDIIINVRRPFCKIYVIFFRFSTDLYLFTLFNGNPQ